MSKRSSNKASDVRSVRSKRSSNKISDDVSKRSSNRVSDVSEIDNLENDKVEKFKIVLVNCHKKTYHPGQFVEGHVILVLKYGLLTRGIILRFGGLVTLGWSKIVPGQGRRCIDTVHYEAAEEFFNVTNYLHEPGLMASGIYEFPFRFHLSPPLPETYEDNICKIEYFLEARIKQDSITIHDVFEKQEILLLSPLNLNEVVYPDVTLPVYIQKVKTIKCLCCCRQEAVFILRLERAGYAPGETIHVQVDIINESSRSIKSTVVSLVEERIYQADGDVLEKREVITTAKKGSVKARSTVEWRDIELHVPIGQLFNVTASQIFTIRHFIEMKVNISWVWSTVVLVLDVTLGAIPLQRTTLDTPAHKRFQTTNKLNKNPTAADIEAENKKYSNRVAKTRLPRDRVQRQTRKERNRIRVQDDFTDTTDYMVYAEELDLYKQRHGLE